MRDGAGNYSLPAGNPVVTEDFISSTTHNTTMADVAQALTNSISKDGQTTYTANQSMGGFRHTSVSDATARNQYATAAQVQDGNLTLIGSVSGSNTITGTLSPAITTYPLGVFLTLIPFQANTGAVTLALNGLAARPIVKFSGVPLVSGDLLAGVPATLVYNGTDFYLENPQVSASDTARLSQPNNFTSNNTFSAVGTGAAPSVRVASANPVTELNNSSAAVNSRSWLNYVDPQGAWTLRADSDDHNTVSIGMIARRSGATVTSLELTASSITLNGANVTDYARKSQANVFQQPVTIGQTSGVGYLRLTGTALSTQAGYIEFFTGDAVRRGFIGFNDGSNRLQIASENGWAYNFTGNSPQINGTPIDNASMLATGVLQNGRVQLSNVTQHQANLAISTTQLSSPIGGISSSVSVDTTHVGKVIIVDNASTITLTVGADAYGGAGKAALYVRRGAGAVTFSASGVTIRSPGGGLSISTVNGKAALIQIDATNYELCGNV